MLVCDSEHSPVARSSAHAPRRPLTLTLTLTYAKPHVSNLVRLSSAQLSFVFASLCVFGSWCLASRISKLGLAHIWRTTARRMAIVQMCMCESPHARRYVTFATIQGKGKRPRAVGGKETTLAASTRYGMVVVTESAM